MPNPSQLFLLADHIKLSLLERQRAISLNLEPNSQDGHISRSLESLREGLQGIHEERQRLEDSGDSYVTSHHPYPSMITTASQPALTGIHIQILRNLARRPSLASPNPA